MATKTDLLQALVQRIPGLDIRSENESANKFRIIMRVPSERERLAYFWPILHLLLLTADKPESAWKLDASKQYLVRNGKLFYGWRFIFQTGDGSELAAYYAEIIKIIHSAPRPARVELDSILLPGYQKGQVRGGTNERGKGSSSAESVPLAVRRR